MNHLNEERLILYYYGEENSKEVEEHLGGCGACRLQYQALQRVLNTVDSAPVPERSAAYGSEVWGRIGPKLKRRRLPWWRTGFGRQWAFAGAMAALVVVAFFVGRGFQNAPPATASNSQLRERVLLVAVGDHLERSQMIIAELQNLEGDKAGKLDISYEQRTAEDLLEANRLYRQTALSTGDAGVANVLDDLERFLLEIAHGPSSLTEKDLVALRKQIEERGILFKVKVFSSQVKDRQGKKKDSI